MISPDEMKCVLATPGMMAPEEIEWLSGKAANVNSWTEVGVYYGRSALAVGLSLPPDGLLQLVDPLYVPPPFEGWNYQELFRNVVWLLSRRPSLRVVTALTTSDKAAELLLDTDVVFLDDDHSYKGATVSIQSWQDKCRILCGHDYSIEGKKEPGLCKAVREFFPDVVIATNTIWVRPKGYLQ